MEKEVEKIIAKAEDCLADAELSLKYSRYIACINRSYYCTFDCIQALLYVKNVFAKTHQGSHTKFHEHYLKTGLLPVELGEKLNLAFDLRQAGDYDFDALVTEEDAKKAFEIAKLFLKTVKDFFNIS